MTCPSCGSNNILTRSDETRRNQPYRCRGCRKDFSVKTGTLMHGSNIGYRAWAIGIYLLTTNLKGVSSLKLHRDLGITQKSAWLMMHKIRETFDDQHHFLFEGPIEVDETYIGSKERNKHANKKLNAGRGAVGKTAVVGGKDRDTNDVRAHVVESTDRYTFQGFVLDNTCPNATVFTDDASAYINLPFNHQSVKYSVGEYVRGMAHTNGVESLWALLKRGYYGTYHSMSVKHLNRYVNEFCGRHNIRKLDTTEQMARVATGMVGKRLT